ncbi:MAG: Bor family protein [Myxococcaceae bacterium]
MGTSVRRLAVVCCFVLVGCYHANIETGRAAGSQRIEKEWASGFLWGLVPPDPISAQETCTDGVSKVETQHSFLNGLVGGLTFGIYTPIDITVTCAAPGGATK